MSANNYWLIHRVGPRYYGWDLQAEAWGLKGQPTISISEALTGGKSSRIVAERMKEASHLGYSEYGTVVDSLHLPKDGTLIKIKELEIPRKVRRIDGIHK